MVFDVFDEFFLTRIWKLVHDISRRRIHILSIYAPTAIDAHTNETLSLTADSFQLSMQSQNAITFSYVVTSTQHCLSKKIVSKTDVVMLMVTLRCSNPLLSAMTCLLPMHTQDRNTDYIRPLIDQMSARHSLIGFFALFVIDVTSGNPIHIGHQ